MYLGVVPVSAQNRCDVDDTSSAHVRAYVLEANLSVHVALPPPDLRNWTPEKEQFRLYVNLDGNSGDTVPRLDILDDKNLDWPFLMERIGDTVYVFIAPPGYMLNHQSRIDGLDTEFPFVVWAGTQRAIFWFSYDSAAVALDTIQSASFITTVQFKPLPDNIVTLQLLGTNRNAKRIKSLLTELGDKASLIQLEDGFYWNLWLRVRKSIVRRWKVNETPVGTFLALRYAAGEYEAVERILQKYRGGDHSNH